MRQRVLLKGRAGLDLLHRISSVDIHALATGVPAPGLILNPEGKILCFFEITRTDGDSAEIAFQEAFLSLMDHYTFDERYELTPLPAGEEKAENEEARILALTPREGFEFHADGRTNPLEVNLRSAIADQKGCYPGQEVIEKIISLGSPARKLCLLRTDKSFAGTLPCPVFSAESQEVGVLTSRSGAQALAVIRRTHLRPGTRFRSADCEWKLIRAAP